MSHFLEITLKSDACFSGAFDFAGEVDVDIEQEETLGLPMIRGRTLKGLLAEECAMILSTLEHKTWKKAVLSLFGEPGSNVGAELIIGDALLPAVLRSAVKEATERDKHQLRAHQVLRSLTDIRHQTKMSSDGVPEEHTLRATRLVLTGIVFYSPLKGTRRLDENARALLAACALALRRGGLNRNRGWGRLQVRVVEADGNDVTGEWARALNALIEVES